MADIYTGVTDAESEANHTTEGQLVALLAESHKLFRLKRNVNDGNFYECISTGEPLEPMICVHKFPTRSAWSRGTAVRDEK